MVRTDTETGFLYRMLENFFRTFKSSPKIEFKSFSVAHGLIRLPRSRDFFAKNFIEKAFNFDFLERKYQKLALFEHFLGFRPQYFFYRLCPNWLIFSTWGFLATADTNLKEFFDFDLIQVPFGGIPIFALLRHYLDHFKSV